MANRLRALKVDFVSMVPRPANQAATFVLAKHDPEPEPYWKRDFSADERKTMASSGVAESDGSYPIPDRSSLSDAIHAYGRSSDPAKTKRHIIARARALGATSMLPADWSVGKANPQEGQIVPDIEKAAKKAPADSTDDNDEDDTSKGMAKAEPETISKAEYAKLETRLATIQKSLDDANTRAQTAEAVAKAEQDARELSTAIAKAEKTLPALPGATSTEIGTLLRDIGKAVSTEQFAKLEAVLLAANAAVAKGDLFKEAGRSHSGDSSGGNTGMDQLQAVAKGLIEKDPELTPAKSIAKAMTLRPDLVHLDRKERGFARD